MKKISVLLLGILLAATSYAQGTQPGCYPYPRTISVTGSAEMNVIPDEIYVQVILREYKKKGEKVELDKIKADFLGNCKTAGIPDSAISVASYEGYDMSYVARRRKKDPELYASIIYQLKFNNTKKIDELVDRLDDDATSNFYIVRTTHSKMVEYRKQLKIMAVRAARDKAVYLSESVNEQLGQAITITEPEEYAGSDILQERSKYGSNVYSNAVNMKEMKSGWADFSNGVDYRRITVRYEVKVLYALK